MPFNILPEIPGATLTTFVVTTLPSLASGTSIVQAVYLPVPPAAQVEPPQALERTKRSLPSHAEGVESHRVSIDEAAVLCGVGKRTVEGWIEKGRIVSVKSGRRRLIERKDLTAFMEREKRATLRNRR